MSEKKNPPQENLPAFVRAAPELLPVWDWWVKEGKSTLIMLIVAALCVGGYYGVRNWMQARIVAANAALVNAYTVEELESAVSDYGSTKVGTAIKLRLAKAYYDAERYQDALDTYDTLVAKADPAFADIAVVGRAHALEGLSKFKEAQEVYDTYAKANTNSYLILDAKLGALRCQALNGDKDAALKGFDALKADAKDEIEKRTIERMTDAVKRHDPKRMARSLFDVANAAASAINAEEKKDVPASVAKPVEPAVPATPAPVKPDASATSAVPASVAKPAAPVTPAPTAPAPAAK